MSSFRVIHRVEPYQHEDIWGYLHRVATTNRIAGIDGVLKDALGKTQHAISTTALPRLAEYCRLHPEEISQLSGLEVRLADGAKVWQVCDEWVSKPSFIAPNRSTVCAQCLRQAPYVRGLWALSLYTACAYHGVELLEACPACGHRLQWRRRHLEYCSCGFELAAAEAYPAKEDALLMSFLIGSHGPSPPPFIASAGIRENALQLLASLSLDGLCKSIWFLGHCLGELGTFGAGHGKLKPEAKRVEPIVGRAFDVMRNWPTRLGDILLDCAKRPPAEYQGGLVGRLLGPVQNYLKQELQDEEFAFVRIAYEQHLREVWRIFGKQHRLRRNKQLEFHFGD